MSTPFIPPIMPVSDPFIAVPIDPIKSFVASSNSGATLQFGKLVKQGIEQVDMQVKASQADLQALASGEALELHNVMIKLEESRLAFQLMLQVRNRLLESYQEVLRMQI